MMKISLLLCTFVAWNVALLSSSAIPRPHWTEISSQNKAQVSISVSTRELTKHQTLVMAACEVAFFDDKGRKMRTQVFDLNTPIAAETQVTQDFAYDPPPVAKTTGITMRYKIATDPIGVGHDGGPGRPRIVSGDVPPDPSTQLRH